MQLFVSPNSSQISPVLCLNSFQQMTVGDVLRRNSSKACVRHGFLDFIFFQLKYFGNELAIGQLHAAWITCFWIGRSNKHLSTEFWREGLKPQFCTLKCWIAKRRAGIDSTVQNLGSISTFWTIWVMYTPVVHFNLLKGISSIPDQHRSLKSPHTTWSLHFHSFTLLSLAILCCSNAQKIKSTYLHVL